MDIEISRHAKKMLRKRVGTRRAEEFFSEALTEGIPHQECKGQLRAYLDKKGMLHKRCSVIYKGIIFFYSTDPDGTRVLVTCYQVPQQFMNTVKSLEDKLVNQ